MLDRQTDGQIDRQNDLRTSRWVCWRMLKRDNNTLKEKTNGTSQSCVLGTYPRT